MSELAATSEGPALQLVTRSRSHGVELVAGPSGRDEGAALEACAQPGAKRTLAVPSPGAGDWLCLGGGGAPLEVAATRSGASVVLPEDTASCERVGWRAAASSGARRGVRG